MFTVKVGVRARNFGSTSPLSEIYTATEKRLEGHCRVPATQWGSRAQCVATARWDSSLGRGERRKEAGAAWVSLGRVRLVRAMD